MIPLLFGTPTRRLYGAYHPSEAGRSPGLGVVICNPFGEELSRTHRFFYVLAERLTRMGIDVLRFDYYGTGDSAGDDGEGELDGWSADLRSAHDELQRRSSAQRIVWMGSRLGGTLAIRCAHDGASPGLQRLLVWDPIVDGAGFLRALRADRAQALETAYSLPDLTWRRRLVEDPEFLDESVSFAVSPRLRDQILSIDARTLELPCAIPTQVIAEPTDSMVQCWAEAQCARGAPVQAIGLAPTLRWVPDGQEHQALVPRHALQQILTALDE